MFFPFGFLPIGHAIQGIDVIFSFLNFFNFLEKEAITLEKSLSHVRLYAPHGLYSP